MIPLSQPSLSQGAWEHVKRALDRNEVSKGDYVELFERTFARYLGMQHASATSNGTMALYLGLRALGVGPGDEVILPALTFAASADAICLVGATPVCADIERETFSLDLQSVEKYVTPRTKALMPVDLYGRPSNIPMLRHFGIPIVQDSCESLGASGLGEADITCFSFYGNKVLTTGEGGMACTNSAPYKKRMDKYRNHGRNGGYWHEWQGTNARMSNISAALGYSQLIDLPKNLALRRQRLTWYGSNGTGRGPWLMLASFPDKEVAVAQLQAQGIDARVGFYPLHLMPAYREHKSLPVAEELGRKLVLLPLYPALTEEEVTHIKAAVLPYGTLL